MRNRPWRDAAYRLIDEMKAAYPVTYMCEELGIAPSAYYQSRRRGPSQREQDNAVLSQAIREIFQSSRESYGAPRVWAELQRRGYAVGRWRVRQLMKSMGCRAVQPRTRWVTTKPGPTGVTIQDHVKRGFAPPALDQIWVADVTCLMTSEGVLYLAVVMDSASRRILGWSLASMQDAALVCHALQAALQQRRHRRQTVIHHSDRGAQYTSQAFGDLCRANNVIQSMGRTGNCYDNSQIESFFSSLKKECVSKLDRPDRDTMRQEVIRWIESWYNKRRLHTQLDFMSPSEFERRVRASKQDTREG